MALLRLDLGVFIHDFHHFQGQYLHAGELPRTARTHSACNVRVTEMPPITDTDSSALPQQVLPGLLGRSVIWQSF